MEVKSKLPYAVSTIPRSCSACCVPFAVAVDNERMQLAMCHDSAFDIAFNMQSTGNDAVATILSSILLITPSLTSRTNMTDSPQRKILVADDNRDSADSTAIFLELVGFETTAVHSGQHAIEAAELGRPQAIILDIGMPDRDGYEVARSIRSTAWGKNVFLIAVTGWGQASDIAQARAAGFNHHMTKPVEPLALQKVLMDFFDSSP